MDDTYVDVSLLSTFVEAAVSEFQAAEKTAEDQPDFVLEKGLGYKAQHGLVVSSESDVIVTLRAFINSYVDETKQILSKRNLPPDQQYLALQRLSSAAQIAILSTEFSDELKAEIADAYQQLCDEAGVAQAEVSVRSSAVGEDSSDAAFAGAQDSYNFRLGKDDVILHVLRDFASGFNVRALEYRLSQIEKDIKERQTTPQEAIKKFHFNNIAVSVCIQITIDPDVAGNVFSVDPSSGMPIITIDSNFGIGETVVGGIVTPDNYQISDDDKLIVRTMGTKTKIRLRSSDGKGIEESPMPEDKVYAWTLTDKQVKEIARQARLIAQRYGIYMDMEFVICKKTGKVVLVQARPETTHNEWNMKHPGVIPMRRYEVTEEAAKTATHIVKNKDGASKGAATGRVWFVKKITMEVLANFKKGDILVAERTDPDFLTLFKRAGAVVANEGGRTSHAAITSRELGIPAVIGVNDLDTLKSLHGKVVTVDGTRGNIYEGKVPLKLVGEDIDTREIMKEYPTETSVGLILADVDQAKALHLLRNIPDFKVGLLRAEFVLGAIGTHNRGLKAYDYGIYDRVVSLHREGTLESEVQRIELQLENLSQDTPTEEETLLWEMVTIAKSKLDGDMIKVIEYIKKTNEDIRKRLKTSGYKTGHELYVEMLAQTTALHARSFEGKDVIYRTTDFKSNEYEGLLGGFLFEPKEPNPMLGYRGVSRSIDPWEIEAFIKARNKYGANNLHIMFPFVRTQEELAQTLIAARAQGLRRGVDGLKVFVMAEIPSIATLPHSFLKYVDGFSIGSNDLTQGELMTDRDAQRLQETYDEENPSVTEATLSIIFAAIKQGKEVGYCGMGVSNSPFIAAMCAVAGITSASATPDVYVNTKRIIHDIESQGITVAKLGNWMQKYKEEKMKKALQELVNTGLFSSSTAGVGGARIDFTPEEAYSWIIAASRIANADTLSGDPDISKRGQSCLRALNKAIKPVIHANTDWNQIVNQALNKAGFHDAREYDQMIMLMQVFEEQASELFGVIPHTPKFSHSTIFRDKVKYLYQRLKTIDEEIEKKRATIRLLEKKSVDSLDIKSEEGRLALLSFIKEHLKKAKRHTLYWANEFGLTD